MVPDWRLVSNQAEVYVKSFAASAPLTPGKVEQFRWALPDVNHIILPGYCIMGEVQSIWRSGAAASAVMLSVVP